MQRAAPLIKPAVSAVLAALALALAPISWFAWGPTKAFPGQHFVNAIAGVTVGPAWAAVIAIVVGTLRISLGQGTIFAYPGGIPGGVVVGLFYLALRRRLRRPLAIAIASLTEPLGTVLIGASLSWYLVDPLVNAGLRAKFLSLLPFYAGWALSSVSGCILAMFVLTALEARGVLRALSLG